MVVGVGEEVGVAVGACVAVAVGVGLGIGVWVGVGGTAVRVGVGIGVAVDVGKGVLLAIAIGVATAVAITASPTKIAPSLALTSAPPNGLGAVTKPFARICPTTTVMFRKHCTCWFGCTDKPEHTALFTVSSRTVMSYRVWSPVFLIV